MKVPTWILASTLVIHLLTWLDIEDWLCGVALLVTSALALVAFRKIRGVSWWVTGTIAWIVIQSSVFGAMVLDIVLKGQELRDWMNDLVMLAIALAFFGIGTLPLTLLSAWESRRLSGGTHA